MKLSTKITRNEMKIKILEAMIPVTHQFALPYDQKRLSESLEVFRDELDKILNIKWED